MSVEIHDNDKTFDRYTVIIDGEVCYGMSINPLSPQGFNQYIGTNKAYAKSVAKRNKKVRFKNLPKGVQTAIKQRLGN